MVFPLAVIADLIFSWEVVLPIKYNCATEKKKEDYVVILEGFCNPR